jgi:GTP-binding protein LepA
MSKRYDMFEIGIVQPNMMPTGILTVGQVGYFLSNMKSVSDAHIGDTFYEEKVQKSDIEPFPGYATPKPMVFAGIYPEDPDDYDDL